MSRGKGNRWVNTIVFILLSVVLISAFSASSGETVSFPAEEAEITNIISDKTNDEAAAGFINRTMTGEEERRRGIPVGDTLTGLDKTFYDLLKAKAVLVAAGELDSTEFEFPAGDFFSTTHYTAGDLDVDDIVAELQAAKAALANKLTLNVDFSRVIDALLADCPYDLYWFDKTAEWFPTVRPSYSISYNSTELDVTFTSGISVYMAVSADYAGENGVYSVNTTYGQSARQAARNAHRIIENHENEGDLAKLKSYRDEICARVSYNDAAAGNDGTPYGNPWQMVWVFDNDENTNVVCEGYSKAFQFLCDESDFDGAVRSILVSGTMEDANSAGPHMWNVVRMDDGKNYLADITNSDSGTIGEDGGLFLAGYARTETTGGTTKLIYRAGDQDIKYWYNDDTITLYAAEDLSATNESYPGIEGTAMILPEWDEVTMDRIVIKGQSKTVQTPIGENIGAIKLTIKDTAEWKVKLTETKNVSAAPNGRLSFTFGTGNTTAFEAGQQYLVELMAMPTEDSAPGTWVSYWSRILTVIPSENNYGLQVFINKMYPEIGYDSLYITAYDPNAGNVWIVVDGEMFQGYTGNSLTLCTGFDEPGDHHVYAVSMKSDGSKTVSQVYTITAVAAANPVLYGDEDPEPLTYSENGAEKSLEELPDILTAGPDGKMSLAFTIHYVRRDLGKDAATLDQQVWYDMWAEDLTTGNSFDVPCYTKRGETDVPHGLLLNESTGDRSINLRLRAGHTYRVSASIRSSGCTPVQLEKTFTVLPATMNNQKISLSVADHTGSSLTTTTGEQFRLKASAPGATVVRFWTGDGFEYLNDWIGDWPGEHEFNWQAPRNEGIYQFYIQAYYGKTNGIPYDELDWDPACISSFLTVTAEKDNTVTAIVPEYTTSPETNIVTQGDYYTVTLTNAEALDAAGASAWAELFNGQDTWKRIARKGNRIMVPTTDLEEGYYTLTVWAETPGAGSVQGATHLFRVARPNNQPESYCMITTTVPADAEGMHTVECYEDFFIAIYAPDKAGYSKYYRIHGIRGWEQGQWWERSINMYMPLDPGEYEIYAEVVYVPEDEEGDEIRVTSEHLRFTATSLGNSGIRLEAPGSYTVTENQEAYTASIVYPDTFDAERPTVEYWALSLESTNGAGTVKRYGSDNGDNLQDSFAFPAELFEAGQIYRLWLHMNVRGYDYVYEEISFAAINEPSANQPALTLTVNGSSAPVVEIPAHEDFRVKVTKDKTITAIRVLNGEHWEYRQENADFQQDWSFGSGTYGLVAMGTTEAPWNDDNFSWENFDWNTGVHWTIISNVVTVKATTEGQLGRPTLTLNKNEYARGEKITATIGKVEGSEWYDVYIRETEGYGNWVYEEHADATGTGELTFTIPTDHIESGSYAIWVNNNAVGYDGNSSDELTFTITEEEGFTPQAVLDIPETIFTNENIRIYSYVPDAEKLRLEIRKKGDSGWNNEWENNWRNYAVWDFGEAFQGTYIFTLYKYVNGERIQALDSVELEVTAPNGSLKYGTVEATPAVLILEDEGNQGITGSFTKDSRAEWYQVRLVYRGPDGSWDDDGLASDFRDGEDIGTTFAYGPEYFTEAGIYEVQVFGGATGYNGTDHRKRILVVEPADETEEHLTLTISGKTDAQQSILSSQNFRIKVAYDGTPPTAVRVLINDRFEHWREEYEGFEHNRSYGDSEMFLYAEATWDDVDLDTIDDWDEELTWSGRSNIIHLDISSPNGEMFAPVYTLNTDENGQIAWGEDLVITVTDEGPTGIPAGEESAEIIEDGWFFCNIEVKRWNGDGSWFWWDRISDDFHIQIHGGVNRIPTYILEDNCQYQIEIGADGKGYSGRSTWAEFTIGERPETQETISDFRVNGSADTEISVLTNEELQLTAYQSSAEWYSVEITKDGEENWYDYRYEYDNAMLMDSWRTNSAGVYTLTAYAYRYIRDEQGEITWDEYGDYAYTREIIGSVRVTANADYGSLDDVSFIDVPDVLFLGEDNDGIAGSFIKDSRAEWYQVRLLYRGPTGDWGDDERENDYRDGRNIDNTFAFGPECFDEAGIYEVQVNGGATGYNGTDNRKRVLVINDSEETLTLSINGETDSQQNILSSQNFQVTVSFETRPTAVRILKGHDFEYWYGKTESFMRSWSFGDEELFVYAEATWDNVDFDTISNWDEEVDWSGRSNIIQLNISSPCGEMTAPVYTLNTDENEQIAWGEDLIITVTDDGPTGIPAGKESAEVISGGWFFFNMYEERWNEDGDSWWDRISDDSYFQIHSGENRIPTYMLEDNCRYRIEIGADGEGYSGRSTWAEFTVGERSETQEPISDFQVNGSTGTEFDILTHEELLLTAYYSGAEWYHVYITKEGDENWREQRDRWWNDMLQDWWRPDNEGSYTLTAYAYGYYRDDQGETTTNEGGANFWEEEIGSVTVRVSAIGALGELHASMPDKAYQGGLMEIEFEEIGTAAAVARSGLDPDEVEYSYWIHTDNDHSWRMGDRRYGAGKLAFSTAGLEAGVYWVELDAMAKGYSQSHATLHFALLDRKDTDLTPEGNAYYFTTSMQRPQTEEGEDAPETDFVVPACEDYRFTFYAPGTEEVSLKQKRSDWRDPNGFAGCEGPGTSQWHSFDRRGVYTVYGQYKANGEWSEDIELCTVTVTAEGSLPEPWVDMPMTVQTGEDVHLTYHLMGNVQSYSYWISFENDNGWQAGEWIDIDNLDEDEIEDDTFDLVIPADRLEANRAYHVYLDVNTPGYEQGHGDRTLYVLGAPEQNPEVLSIAGPDEIVFSQSFPIEVNAPGAEETYIWWQTAGQFRYTEGSHAMQWFCQDWNPGEDQYDTENDACQFYAIALYNASELKVSPTISIPFNREDVGEAPVPTLTLVNQDPIYRGQFIEVIVGAIDGETEAGAEAYQVFMTDPDNNWAQFAYCDATGSDIYRLLLPTNDLEAGQTYNIQAYVRVPGTYRTDSEPIPVEIHEPEESFFTVNRREVTVMEPLMVSIAAPGAERIRFSSGYDEWWDENGWEGDSWFSDDVHWDMHSDTVTMKAEAWFSGAEDWTPVGEPIRITITAEDDLAQPQFTDDFPASISELEDLNFTFIGVENAEDYQICVERIDGREYFDFRQQDTNVHIPADRLYSGGYRIRIQALAWGWNAGEKQANLYVEPARPEILVDSVVSNAKTLEIQVPLIGNNREYNLRIHHAGTMDYEYDEKLYDEDAADGILTFTVPAGTLEDDGYWVDCYVSGEGFFAENAKAFLVRNGQETDTNITLKVNDETTQNTRIMINEKFKVSAEAPGARAIIFRLGDQWQAIRGDSGTTEFSEWQTYPETLYAQAYYGDGELPEDPWDSRWPGLGWNAPCEPIEITFYAIGQAGEPWGRFPNIVTQGEILVISDIYPGENGNETHANINRNQPWQEEDRVFGDDWRGWDERSKTIYLPTDDLEPNRDYWIMLDNSGVGMEGNRMWWRVSVFPKEEEPENGVTIHSLKKAQAGMTVPVSVSAKGAAEVGFGLDLAADEKGDVTKYQFRGEEGADSFFTNGGWFSIYETGEHALTAYAVFPDSDELVYTDTTITICDPLRFDMTAMPGYFTEGQDNAGVTVKLPANAQRMFIQIRAECEDCWQDIYESRERDETEDTTIEIPAEYLTAGNRIRVDFQAQAEGFEDIGDGITIPVVAGTQSNLVNLRLVNNREDQTALDLGDIWANQEMVFLATPTNGNEITAIRFFNGHDWWENGEAITRDNHGDWYMNDGSVFFQERYNDDNNRAITAFAEVRVNGSETWQRTNEIRFTVQNHGMVGWYDFADGSDITVPRGTVITVEFTEAENATHYWVDAFDENNRGWDPWSWDDGTTVRINTNRLPAGVYELRGRAGGSEESGLLWRESDSSIRLIITDDIPPMPAAAFTTPAGLQRIEDEAFAGIAAKVVRIHSNVEFIGDSAFAGSQTETVIIENAYTDINFNAFAECGDLVVYGIPGGDVEQWAQRNMYTFYPIPMQ